MLPVGFRIAAPSTLFSTIGPNQYCLSGGSVLLQAPTGMQMETPQALVMIRKGAIVLVSARPNFTRVRDLWDFRPSDVKVAFGQNYMTLSPGKEIMVTDLPGDPLPVVFSDGLSRRNVAVTCQDGYHVVTSDFSITNLLAHHPIMLSLRQSCVPRDQHILGMVIKMGAVVGEAVDRYKGPYYVPVIVPGTGVARALEPMF
jgi:hypothetical protein